MFDIYEFYCINNDFKNYVDAYCKNYIEGTSITLDEALSHSMVLNVAKYYLEIDENDA